jgi:hypothetical protein
MVQSAGSRQHDKTKAIAGTGLNSTTEPTPRLTVRKIGIASRDYNHKYSNGFRDFSATFSRVLRVLDDNRCDTVLFSPFSIIPRKSFDPYRSLRGLQHVKSVLYEEFIDGQKRRILRSVVFHRQNNIWRKYELPSGGFPKLRGSWQAKKRTVYRFTREVLPGRILGNCAVIICGESNAVPYHQNTGRVGDDFGLRRSLLKDVTVILNPVHDWMSRHEMEKKRSYLSENNRWVISVWNKGKRDKNDKPRDAKGAPWTVFHNGREMAVEPLLDQKGVDIGIRRVS